MSEFLSRLAKPGTLLLAAIVVALAFAFVYEHSFFGTLQYVTAFAFYLAVMACVAPLPALLRRRGRSACRTGWPWPLRPPMPATASTSVASTPW